MARIFTFNADGVAGNATTQLIALFSDATFPLSIRLTNHMTRGIALPSVGVFLKEAANSAKRTAVVKIKSISALVTLAADIEAITEGLDAAPAIVLTDDVEAPAVEAPDVPYPVTYSSKSGMKANGVSILTWLQGVVRNTFGVTATKLPVLATKNAAGTFDLTAGEETVVVAGGGGGSSSSSSYTFSTLWATAKLLSSVYRINPAYTGALVRLREEAFNTEKDFGDVTSAAGRREVEKFAGGYGLRLVTAYDQSGNGNHQTQSTPALQPAFVYHGGKPIIACRSYDGQDRRLPLPTAFSFNRRSATVLQMLAIQTGIQGQQTWEFGSATGAVVTPSLTPATDMNVQLKETGAIRSIGNGMHSIPGSMTTEAIFFRFDAAAVRFKNSRGQSGSTTPCAAGSYTGGNILGTSQDWPAYSFECEVWAVWNTALSDADVALLDEDCDYLGACKGYHNLLFVGDSITEGIVKDKPGINYASALKGLLNANTLVRCMGKSGQLLSEMNGIYANFYAPFVLSGRINVLVLAGGTNDFMVANATSASVIAAATDLATKARASGWKVVICTLIPASNAAYDATDQSNRSAYNAWIRGTAVQSGIADSIIDLEALPPFQSATNLRYMPDSLHPSGLAYRAAAPYIMAHLEQYGFLRAGDVTLADF